MGEEQTVFSTLEIDTIGEIMNISMGSAATAASTLLDNKVTITTPVVKLVNTEDFEIMGLEPAIAVDIRYVEGISGSNILILHKEDVRTILGQMMMTEVSEDFIIDELATSAICELMNQMMGSSATVLSCFLGRSINISTPETVAIDRLDEFKKERFGQVSQMLTIEFTINIEDIMESQFVSVMDVDLAKEIISVSLNFDSGAESEEAASPPPPPPAMDFAPPPDPLPPSPVQQAAPPPMPPPVQQQAASPPPFQQPAYQQPDMGMPTAAPPYPSYPPQDPNMASPPYGYPPYPYPPPQPYPPQGYPPPQQGYYPPPSPIKVQGYEFGDFGAGGQSGAEHRTNMDLVMNVPVVVTVELGRTKRKIKEILEFGQGTIVELDKQAGSQVDVIVNGELIAHGDVVVVDDNFSIRITEILKNRDSIAIQ